MKFKKKTAAVVALSAIFACGALAGCDLVTTNSQKDLLQVIAEVDITKGDDFAANGDYYDYREAISKSEILKRDLIANYVSVGYQYVQNYGYSYERAFELIKDSLVNRAIYLQYAKVYLFQYDSSKTPEGYKAAVASQKGDLDSDIAGLAYFLDEDEVKKAQYNTKVSINQTIDSQEQTVISGNAHNHTHTDDTSSTTARTTPTGIDTVKEDYYDEAYNVYTGANSPANCGSYETIDDSTSSTRRAAYEQFLASLDTYALVSRGEDTSDIQSLTYYKVQLKSYYEDALINKLTDAFEEKAKSAISKEWIESEYERILESQRLTFDGNRSTFETALDSISDSSFVLYAPDENYGFVINILLPFSTTQSKALENALSDYGDKRGNFFNERAKLLKNVMATDQRGTWFTGSTDYSYELGEGEEAYTGGSADRNFLFFRDSFQKTEQYESVPNYLGSYTYNGKVIKTEDEDGETEYELLPNRISIDGFLDEMKSYLEFAGFSLTDVVSHNDENDSYFSKAVSDYYGADGKVDYSSFLYYEASVAKDGTKLSDSFNANRVFVEGSDENRAMSVINELSFAYNTDTGNLNSYLGYAVSPDNTDFVKEFEYAAQKAVEGGAGTVTVAPSEYGWHIMYCTFSFKGATPFSFNWEEIGEEGTFSYQFYEAKKASNIENYSSMLRTRMINVFNNDQCVEVYKDRYSDLSNYQEA